MEGKKISFGFSKIQKKIHLQSTVTPQHENKRELIKCLEGQSIQLLEEKPRLIEELLVIPLKEATVTAGAFASLKARHNALHNINEQENETDKTELKPEANSLENESIERRAARELLEAAIQDNGPEENDQSVVIPKPDELPLNGAKESSFDDYESVPISKYGYAMLRGMGWKESAKSKADKIDIEERIVRPKGMGLGADKIARPKPLLVPPDSNEILEIKKNACVRILAGKHKDLYGQIEGFDDHAGRVIVKLALGGNYESLNEFMVQPVSKKEYAQYSKVINSAKYEEYKKIENSQDQMKVKALKDESSIKTEEDSKTTVKVEKSPPDTDLYTSKELPRKIQSEDGNEYRSNKSKQEASWRERSRHDGQKTSRNSSSSSGSSDHHFRGPKKKSSKSKKHKHSNRDHHHKKYTSSEDEKRHKKKTKKSKRPRSRSKDRRT